MDHHYTDEELDRLEKIQKDLILSLFESEDKRYSIIRALKEAFRLGEERTQKTGSGGKE